MNKSIYIPRIIDNILEEHLDSSGAVLISGPKWCGKTTTAKQCAKSMLEMQDPDKSNEYLATSAVKPSLLLDGENPRLLDEWQIAPVLWDAVRVAVDRRNETGLFILTGSTTVDESQIMHSGTGRISRLIMYPMSLYESGESNGKIPLSALFNNPKMDIDGVKSGLSIENLVFAACRGGWPSSLNRKTDKAILSEAQKYLVNICNSDASLVDGIKRSSTRVKAVLQSYARNISTPASNKTILSDVSVNHMDISEPTLLSYINALERLFVIDDIPAWCPAIRSATTIRSRKKRGFIDPSIAVASLALSPDILLRDMLTFGFIFENLCTRDLKIYSSSLGGYVSYYRDRFNLEADCVLHLPDGRYALIEIKLGSQDIEDGAAHLIELKSLIKKANSENKARFNEPDLLIVITGGEMAYTRNDGVKIIPIGSLKD